MNARCRIIPADAVLTGWCKEDRDLVDQLHLVVERAAPMSKTDQDAELTIIRGHSIEEVHDIAQARLFFILVQ